MKWSHESKGNGNKYEERKEIRMTPTLE